MDFKLWVFPSDGHSHVGRSSVTTIPPLRTIFYFVHSIGASTEDINPDRCVDLLPRAPRLLHPQPLTGGSADPMGDRRPLRIRYLHPAPVGGVEIVLPVVAAFAWEGVIGGVEARELGGDGDEGAAARGEVVSGIVSGSELPQAAGRPEPPQAVGRILERSAQGAQAAGRPTVALAHVDIGWGGLSAGAVLAHPRHRMHTVVQATVVAVTVAGAGAKAFPAVAVMLLNNFQGGGEPGLIGAIGAGRQRYCRHHASHPAGRLRRGCPRRSQPVAVVLLNGVDFQGGGEAGLIGAIGASRQRCCRHHAAHPAGRLRRGLPRRRRRGSACHAVGARGRRLRELTLLALLGGGVAVRALEEQEVAVLVLAVATPVLGGRARQGVHLRAETRHVLDGTDHPGRRRRRFRLEAELRDGRGWTPVSDIAAQYGGSAWCHGSREPQIQKREEG